MKAMIENSLRYYPELYRDKVAMVLEHLFCVLGNGIDMTGKGYIRENYRSNEVYPFGEPEPMDTLYPYCDGTVYQKYAGCRMLDLKKLLNISSSVLN